MSCDVFDVLFSTNVKTSLNLLFNFIFEANFYVFLN